MHFDIWVIMFRLWIEKKIEISTDDSSFFPPAFGGLSSSPGFPVRASSPRLLGGGGVLLRFVWGCFFVPWGVLGFRVGPRLQGPGPRVRRVLGVVEGLRGPNHIRYLQLCKCVLFIAKCIIMDHSNLRVLLCYLHLQPLHPQESRE